jgi:ubiquinone/menaquinone biosynthesis C-methylase UbiE
MTQHGMDISREKDVSKAYDLMADTYDDINSEAFYINQYNCYETHIKSHLDYLKGRRILDLGCGTGIQALFLSDYVKEIIGIDISENLLEKARKKVLNRKNITFQKADATKLPFNDNSFEAIISYGETISHIQDYEKAFEEASRVLEEGSIFIFSVLNKWNIRTLLSPSELRNALSSHNGHTRTWSCAYSGDSLIALKLKTFSENEIKQLLERNKFQVIDITGIHIVALLIPLEYQYGEVNLWGKIFIHLGKFDKIINEKRPFNNLGYTKIITAIKGE